MARLPALIDAYAKYDGRDPASLHNIGRTVRNGDLIATAKRGVGGATMRCRDARNLLIGANGSDAAKDAARAVELFSGLYAPAPHDGTHDSRADIHAAILQATSVQEAANAARYMHRTPPSFGASLPVTKALNAAETFGDALEIVFVRAGEILAMLKRYATRTWSGHVEAWLHTGCGLRVHFIRAQWPVAARIVFHGLEGEIRSWHFVPDMTRMSTDEQNAVLNTHRTVTASVDFWTILAMAQLTTDSDVAQ